MVSYSQVKIISLTLSYNMSYRLSKLKMEDKYSSQPYIPMTSCTQQKEFEVATASSAIFCLSTTLELQKQLLDIQIFHKAIIIYDQCKNYLLLFFSAVFLSLTYSSFNILITTLLFIFFQGIYANNVDLRNDVKLNVLQRMLFSGQMN